MRIKDFAGVSSMQQLSSVKLKALLAYAVT